MKANKIYTLTNENFHQEIFNNKMPVLVEFSTKWCGTSHIIAPILKELAVLFKDRVKFYKSDIDDYEDIAAEFGIRRIPTILLFKNSEVVDFIYGVVSKEILIEKLNALIKPTN